MTRLGGFLLPLALALGVAVAPARARAEDDDEGPWRRGIIMPSLGLGASFGPDLHVINIGLGVTYFVVNGLGVGLDVGDTILIWRDDFVARNPGLKEEVPTNIVEVMPNVQYVFLRRYRFSPYVAAGVGPVFYNNQRGTVGQWMTGAGVLIGLARWAALNVGVSFSASFPDSKWQDAFSYNGESIRGCAIIDSPCSFMIYPRIGLVFSFGGKPKDRSERRERRRKKHEEEAVPVQEADPYEPFEPEPEPAPKPAPAPAPAPAPEPVAPAPAPEPVEPAPETPPPMEPVEPPEPEPTEPEPETPEPETGEETPPERPPVQRPGGDGSG